jgi:tripartite-type tricarboxylate transporter receptor subunit TctC
MSASVVRRFSFESRRRQLVFGLAAGSVLVVTRSSFGADVPNMSKAPVRFILAQTPGTTPDVIARLLAPKFSESWSQPFVVENRPGASGAIGMEAVAKAPPDGHTMIVNVSTTVTLPYFYRALPFDVLKSFEPVGLIGSGNFALTVHSSVPVNDVKEFVAYVKARPGQLNYGTPGYGTHHHLCMELLKVSAGLDIVHVPYKGAAGATTDLLAGHIPTMFLPIHTALALSKDGRIKVLGGSKRERHPLFPAIPSLHEQGITGFDVDPWYALWGPAGLLAELVAKYNAELRRILAQPDMNSALAGQGLLVKPSSPEELAQIAKAEYEMWGRVVREAKIQPS